MMDSIRLAKVAAVHPEANSVDLVFIDNGSQIPMVQVMGPIAGTDFGQVGLVEPSIPPSGDKWDLSESKDRDIMAVVGFLRNYPIVLGFLLPQVCQMTFADKNRRIDRHPSDVYTTIDDEGNVELALPNGSYVRFGTSPDHEDLTGKDFDKKWKISKNTDKALHFHLSLSNGADSEVKASLHIDPSGNITLNHKGDLTTNTGGNLVAEVAGTAEVTVQGDITVTTPASVTVDAPLTTFTGQVVVEGLLTYQGGMVGSGGSGGAAATISGDVVVSGGDVTADGISVKTHRHGGVQSGPSNTGGPI